ncbi:MAG: hypothetical protein J6T48_10300 [Bacteroidales bacterium]|nr:hypothetical protein [Bacteroidales bacterium]
MKQILVNIGLGLAVLLLLCLFKMPYGYYTFIRFLAMVYFVCLAVSFGREKLYVTISAGILAILFQPFFKIALGRTMWNVVDVFVAIALVLLWFLYRWMGYDK